MPDRGNEFLVLCDFDGTLTQHDLGAELVRQFADPTIRESLLKSFFQETITLYELQSAIWHAMRLREDQLLDFLAKQRLRRGFNEMRAYLHNKNIPLHVVSGGFDLYIEPFLERHGIFLPTHMNQARLVENLVEPRFPHRNQECDYCSNCKGKYIRDWRRANPKAKKTMIIVIGDGHSDFCMISEAQLIFARAGLKTFCEKFGIDHLPFDDFFQVTRQLQKIM